MLESRHFRKNKVLLAEDFMHITPKTVFDFMNCDNKKILYVFRRVAYHI